MTPTPAIDAILKEDLDNPHREHNGVSAMTEAEARGHRLATEIMRAWAGKNGAPPDRASAKAPSPEETLLFRSDQ